MAVDLPALLRPTKAISGSSVGGNWSKRDAVVRNLAVCVHASAVLATLSVTESTPATVEEGMLIGHCKINRFAIKPELNTKPRT
jgi:hypothetical protein